MSTYTETISSKLNDLLERTYDAEKGFKKAAENTEHTYLKRYFERKSLERQTFGVELKNEIRSFGETPEDSGSFEGAAHRTWMDIKALFSSDNDESMLEEAIRGENTALNDYNDVINDHGLPLSTQSILIRQRDAIASDLQAIKRLEDLH
jgi:uncharacterized protein (TIGR02284 family)